MTQKEALYEIAECHGGILRPEDVVDAARDESSVLHSAFEWDDGVAAEKYRRHQAEQMIRVTYETIPVEETKFVTVRAFTSLTTDRNKGGGYRKTVTVLSDANLYKQLCKDAAEEFRHFQQKFSKIKELSKVFGAGEEFIHSLE